MNFIYNQLYAVFNTNPSYLPSQNMSDRKRIFGKSFSFISIVLLLMAALPTVTFAQNTNFNTGIDMRVAGNYTLGIPTNAKDILVTTTSGPLVISSSNLTGRSLNVTNGSSYIIGDSSTTNNRSFIVGNPSPFSNFYSGVQNDLFYLTNNSSLTMDSAVYAGIKALGITLASSGNFNVQSGSTLTISSAINGSPSVFNITKTGGGTFNLLGTGASNLGTITVSAGVFSVVNSGIPSTTLLTLNGGSLQANGNVTTAVTNNITLGGGAFDNNGNVITLKGSLSGTDLISTGAGTLLLSIPSAATYTGNTFIKQGTVKTPFANTLPSGTIVNFGQASSVNLGTFDLDNFSQQVAGLNSVTGTNATGSSNTVLNSGAALRILTLGGAGSYAFGSGSAANSGIITGNMSVTMTGTGTQILGGVNSYTGTTTFTNGDLRFALPSGSAQSLAAAAFKGGTLSTLGSASGTSLTFSTVSMTSSSTINLDSTVAHTITFTAVAGLTAGQILTIKGWKGVYNGVSSGTEGQIFAGGSLLSAAKLATIEFVDGAGFSYAATQLVSGEIVPTTTLSITPSAIPGSPYCAGASGIAVNFTYLPTSIFSSGSTTFTAQLSNAAGTFGAPVNLQSVVADGSGNQTINVTIPPATPAGLSYKIRIVSSTPAFNGKASNAIVINSGGWIGGNVSFPNDWNTASNWCSGAVPTAGTSVEIPAGLSFYPNITSPSYVNNIMIDAGASVTLSSGGTLSIHGAISNSGVFDATSGTIEMSGSAAQSIGGSMFVSSIISNLTDSNTNATTGLSINSGDPVNITGQLNFGYTTAKLTTNNGLVLVSNASITASVGQIAEVSGVAQATITGNITVQRFYPAHRRWRLITAPVKSSGAPTINAAWQEGGQSIAGSVSNPSPGFGTGISGPNAGAFVASSGYDQSANNSPSMAMLAAANSWFSLPSTFVSVSTYQGYMLFTRGDRSFPIFTGTALTPATTATLRTTGAINTGRVTVPVNSGFTVIGNPYPATINFNNVYTSSASALTSNSFSLWDPNIGSAANVAAGTGGWVTLSWNGTSYDASPDPTLFDGFDTNGDIQSGAAYAVDGTGSGSVQMDESNKVTGTDNHLYLFRPSGGSSSQLSKLSTTLYSTDTTNAYLADGVLNEFSSDYTNDLNFNKDIKKLFSFNERISILKSSQNLSIQKSAPAAAGDTIHYAVGSLKQAPYQLVIKTNSFARPDLKAFLIDSFTNTSTPVLLGDTSTTVNFTVTSAPASYAAARFSIVFAEAPGSVTYTSVTATQENKNIAVEWVVDNQLNINKYVVEKSIDGTNFYPVDTTMATTGSSSTYDWLDVNTVVGHNYYRIRSIDNTGAITYSKTVDVVIGKGIIAGMQIYPNPVTDGTIELQMNNVPAGEYGIKVLSTSGQVLLTETINHGASSETHPILLNKQLANGIYILEVIHPDKTITKINFENQ